MTKLITQAHLMIVFIICAWLSPTLHAHLLPAQRGTLNIVDQDGVYMVLSLPISAFDGVDDDKNGFISMVEFNKHRASIINRVKAGVVLSEKNKDHLIQGIMLSPVSADEHSTSVDQPIARVYIMGKFVLNGSPSSNSDLSKSSIDLRFRNELYGTQESERTFTISATRNSSGQKHTFKLTPKKSQITLFSEKKIAKTSK